MKKQIFFPAFLVAIFLWSGNIQAQVEDVANPLLKYVNRNNGLRFTAGGRLFTDVAYYHSEYTPMKSGAAITDARIRTSLKYKQFYFYADFDFSKGSFKQKNIFGQYNFKENYRGVQSVKAGYFCEPSTMAYNTSLYNYHFISRPAVVNALAPGRSLGITYKFFNQKVLADQGIFAENKYNDQISGFQGFSLSGRWLYKVINDDYMTLHVGLGLRYSRINTGRVVDDDAFKTEVTIESAMETYVDATTKFLNADVAWAKNILDLNPELLFKTDRLFVRGEYLYKRLYKDRPDFELFTNQLGGVWSWTTLDAWKAGNPIRSTKFDGGYVWKIQCKLPPKTKRFCPLKTFNNAPLKSLDRWGYYYFSLFPSVCSHFTDTFSCQLNPVRRMYNTIHNGICYCRVSDCIIPIVRWQLRGDDDGLAPMSVLYYIEQDGSFLGIKVHKEEVIQYEQRAPFDSLEFRFQCAFYFCHLKRTHKFRSIRIICPYALLAGFIPHCCGKEALPGTG